MDFVSYSPPENRPTNSSKHSKIEKRRRDRMNELIGQLATLIPATFSRKLDKLSVLQLALSHINAMSTSNDKKSNCDSCAEHATFTDLLTLLKKNINHFITVVDASTGKIMYAPEEMYKFLGNDRFTRNWYEIIHPIDAVVFKREARMDCYGDIDTNVCEAVSSSTGYHYKKAVGNLGLRRSFPCRLRVYKSQNTVNDGANPNSYEQSYEIFNCYGLMRDVGKPIIVMLLIKPLSSSGIEAEFQIIIAPKGQIVRCGSELPSVLERLPQDLIGCCYYDLVHEGDLLDVAYHHKQVLNLDESRRTSYRIRTQNKQCIKVDATWIPFTNPWNLKKQFIIINHRTNSLRSDEESNPVQSVLKQLLANQQSRRICQEKTTGTTILGVARLGESAANDA